MEKRNIPIIIEWYVIYLLIAFLFILSNTSYTNNCLINYIISIKILIFNQL